jgi:hypothetical protein
MNSLGLRLVSTLALTCCASSCTHVPLASAEEDASAKTFETRPEWCGMYVFREGSLGGSTELELTLDGYPIGSTAGGDYLFTWLKPGSHTLASRTDEDMSLSFQAKADSHVFIRQEGEMGYWTFASRLTLVSADEGQRAVRGCVRVQTGY